LTSDDRLIVVYDIDGERVKSPQDVGGQMQRTLAKIIREWIAFKHQPLVELDEKLYGEKKHHDIWRVVRDTSLALHDLENLCDEYRIEADEDNQ